MEISPLSVLTFGFLLGLKHAMDADHVVAVTTIVSQQRKLRHAALVGITWGIGHTFMIILVGIAILLFRLSISEKTQLTFEFIVAIALVVLGILTLTGATKRLSERFARLHHHLHHHDYLHTHAHSHDTAQEATPAVHESVPEFLAHFGPFPLIRPLIIGILHGLAGSAAIALLVLGSIANQTMAIMYLGIFGAGTIVGMMLVTTLLGVPIIAGNKIFSRFDTLAGATAGILSVTYGIWLGYYIGVVNGLFFR